MGVWSVGQQPIAVEQQLTQPAKNKRIVKEKREVVKEADGSVDTAGCLGRFQNTANFYKSSQLPVGQASND